MVGNLVHTLQMPSGNIMSYVKTIDFFSISLEFNIHRSKIMIRECRAFSGQRRKYALQVDKLTWQLPVFSRTDHTICLRSTQLCIRTTCYAIHKIWYYTRQDFFKLGDVYFTRLRLKFKAVSWNFWIYAMGNIQEVMHNFSSSQAHVPSNTLWHTCSRRRKFHSW